MYSNYTWVDGLVEYPLFEYVLEQDPNVVLGFPVLGESGQIRHPLEIHGLEFQDLVLPVNVAFEGVTLKIPGGFGLPDLDQNSERALPLLNAPLSGKLILVSNVIGLKNPKRGEPIAEVSIEGEQDQSVTKTIRLGEETQAWDRSCEDGAPCTTVFQWHKRIALVGQRRYLGAWKDFQAGIFASSLTFEPMKVTKITIRFIGREGQLYVWGLALPPLER